MSNPVLTLFILLSSWSALAKLPPQKTVLIGDSHTVGYFGEALASELTRTGLLGPVERFGVVGASAGDWMMDRPCDPSCARLGPGYVRSNEDPAQTIKIRPPRDFLGLTGVLSFQKPSTVVFALGTNDAAQMCQKEESLQRQQIDELIKTWKTHPQSGRLCFWVSPPTYAASQKGLIPKHCSLAQYNNFLNVMGRAAGGAGCEFIDSRKLGSFPTASDGLHFGPTAAKNWAKAVAGKISERIKFPLAPAHSLQPSFEANPSLGSPTSPP